MLKHVQMYPRIEVNHLVEELQDGNQSVKGTDSQNQ